MLFSLRLSAGCVISHFSCLCSFLSQYECSFSQMCVLFLIWDVWQVSDCCIFGRPFVKRFALCCRSVVWLSCLSVLSLTFVHCGQTVGRIKMKLGMQVGLGPGPYVLDGDPAPLPQRGRNPTPNFRPISVAAKWLDGSRCHLVWR